MESSVSLKTLIGEERLVVTCPAGLTLGALMDEAKVPLDLRGYIIPLNHGLPIRDLGYVTRPGDRITFAVVPQGKNAGMILAAVAMIAIAVIAPYLGGLAAGAILGTTTGAGYTLLSTSIALGISLVGSLLVSALIPPPSVSNAASGKVASPLQESPTYAVSGQANQARKYSPIPRIYGRHRFFPNIAGTPLIENEGKTSRITALYDFGYGDITIQDLKIGDLGVDVIKPDIQTHQNTKTPNLRLVSKNVAYDQLQYRLEKDKPVVVRTKENAISAAIDINFPRGLVRYDAAGNRVVATVPMEVYYRKFGDSVWIRVPGSRFRGMGIDVETLIWVTAYEKNKTEWVETNFQGGDQKWTEIVIRSNSVQIAKRVYGLNQGPQSLKVGATDYRRGGSRETTSPNAKTTIVRYELQTGTPVTSKSTILSESTGQAITCAVNIPFSSAGVYEIQVVRKSDVSDSNTLYNEAYLTLIKSFKSGKVINLDRPHTMLELSVVASDKISGIVQNLSAICMSRLRWHDGVDWQDPVETRNPAWIVLDILTGAANKTPLRDDQLDLDSWLRLAALCDEEVTTTVNGITTTQPRYMCDVVIDFRTTVQEIVSSILSMCRAQLIITQSGKYGVLIDAEQSTPRQVFTPANSWGFSGVRAFTDKPHAFRVKFIDPSLAWQTAEFNVYADGYDETSATIFEDLQTFGITGYAQAYRYGRYMLAQGIYRSEVFSLKTDVENLAVQRGELVNVAHDVPRIGGTYARVKAISGNDITIDQSRSEASTAYTVRMQDGAIRSGTITLKAGDSSFTLDSADGIETGDLIVIGETDRVVGEYLVLDITPGPDLTADLSLVPYVPEIYAAGEDAPPAEWTPLFGRMRIFESILAVSNLSADYTIAYIDRRPVARVAISWQTEGDNLSQHTITIAIDGIPAFNLDDTQEQFAQWSIDLLANPEYVGKSATITVTPYTRGDIAGSGETIEFQIPGDTTAPNAPERFGLNVQSETISLFWIPGAEEDLDRYELRFSPDVESGSWENAQKLATVGWQQTRVSVGARTGTYMIRAVDTSGNYSPVSYQRTTIASLPNVNIIEEINDRDATPIAWPGPKSGLEVIGGNLVSTGPFGSVDPDGYYQIDSVLDLGDVYESRISSMIEAYGLISENIIASWETLAATATMAAVPSQNWDAWLEVSTSDSMIFIASWGSLSSIASIYDSSVFWSPWRPVNVGDFTGQLYRFRIRTTSFDPAIKVVVSSGLIKVDMPDRIWSANDLSVPIGGLTVSYDPPFRVPPVLAVTVDGNVDAVIPEISNRTASSFDVILKTTAGVAKTGTIDVMAKGYGRKAATAI